MLYSFSNLDKNMRDVGGKAYMLAMMLQEGIRVPNGMILNSLPTEEEFQSLSRFLKEINSSVAVRSSSRAEDSKENSFAGQNSTFLYIDNDKDLKDAINKCFASVNNDSSKAYRKYFMGSEADVAMNVVVQEMVDPIYSGVYFSKDPRGVKEGWILEYIDGVGEDLVSGKRTPESMSEFAQKHDALSQKQVNELIGYTTIIEERFNDLFDIEWAIGQDQRVYILQARPITAKFSHSNIKNIISLELDRLRKEYSKDTIWDGQTFSELTVSPSRFSSALWTESFAPDRAFDLALKKIGYLGFEDVMAPSILNTIFGQSYINLKELGKLYFGDIPYQIVPKPRPHLKFKLSLITFKMLLNAPKSMWKMLSVGLSVNTSRNSIIKDSLKDLVKFRERMQRPSDPQFYESWSDTEIDERILKEWHVFSKHTLCWPYILISLTETTIQTLQSLLSSIVSDDRARDMIREWCGQGIHTKTYEMNRYFKKACARPELRPMFLARYGHRGPGELDLSSIRWAEMGEDSFYDLSIEDYEKSKLNHKILDVKAEIENLKSFKKSIVLEEWIILKKLLELREEWKMQMLKPFAHIRFLLLEKAKRIGLNDANDIFWLDLAEVMNFFNLENPQQIINSRKEEAKLFKNINLSAVTSLNEIEDILSGKSSGSDNLKGEGLSTGLVKGNVVVVDNPANFKNYNWPENPIIVAQSTDPGWTSIFTKASGIIVERGGVLSHCAIVAREMGIPAVSEINNCHLRFKGGESVWVDGSTGNIKLN